MEDRSKRIAKNTFFLYIRSLVTMFIGLYTGRVQLEALGIDNYGINSVVGSIVSFSSLITGSMAAASSRYITYAIGQGKIERMKQVFSTVANVQLIIGIAAVFFLELAGVWFLNSTANIPEDRMFAANWVLQNAILSTFIGIASVQYSATIIAHEHMSFYAYMAIFDAAAKLIICYLILHYGGDRLILFSSLWTLVSIISALINAIYSRRFAEARYCRKVDRKLLREMLGFSGWNFLNHSSWVFITQGVNMLINVFFGVAFNAARGVANTVNNCVQSLVGNFTTAFSPQITKSYASGDFGYCFSLVNRSTKFTWFLMLVFIVPITIEANTLLSIWLVDVPPFSALFLRFALFESLAVASGSNLLKLIQADGHLKRYSVGVAIYVGLGFPLTWLAYHFDAPVWTPYALFIFLFFSVNVYRLDCVKRLMDFSIRRFIFGVIKPCMIVTAVSFTLPMALACLMQPGLLRFFVIVPVSVAYTVAVIYALGLDSGERMFVVSKLKALKSRFIPALSK